MYYWFEYMFIFNIIHFMCGEIARAYLNEITISQKINLIGCDEQWTVTNWQCASMHFNIIIAALNRKPSTDVRKGEIGCATKMNRIEMKVSKYTQRSKWHTHTTCMPCRQLDRTILWYVCVVMEFGVQLEAYGRSRTDVARALLRIRSYTVKICRNYPKVMQNSVSRMLNIFVLRMGRGGGMS